MFLLCRPRVWLPAIALLTIAASTPAAEIDKYLLNDTDAVLALNVRQAVDSAVFKKYYRETLDKLLADNDGVKRELKDFGIDPFQTISRVLLVHGENSHRLASKPGDRNELSYFFILRGKFTPAKIHARADQIAQDSPKLLKVEKVGTARLYELRIGRPLYIAVPDSTAIVASFFKDQVVEAIEKGTGKRKTVLKYKDVQTLIQKADAKESIWVAATGRMVHSFDTKITVENGKKVEKTVKESLADAGVESIAGGLALTDGLSSTFTIATKDEATSKSVAAYIQMDLNDWVERAVKAAAAQKQLEPLRVFLLNIKMTPEGKTVTIKSDVSAKEIADALK
jgi:hypothetical protein